MYNKTYYRLKQIDFDGAWKYSPTVAVSPNKDIIRNLSVSVNEKNTADFDIAANEDFVSLRLLDMLGREINIGQSFDNTNGHLHITMPENTANHQPVYIISLNTTKGVYSRKIRL